MNVKGVRRAEDLEFKVPKPLAEVINELVDAMERDDEYLDCYQDELEGTARMVRGEREDWLNFYYLEGGWRGDVIN